MAAGSPVKVSAVRPLPVLTLIKAGECRFFQSGFDEVQSAMRNYARRSHITPAAILWVPILIAMSLIVLTVFGVIQVRPN
jgi:hypothetical protein